VSRERGASLALIKSMSPTKLVLAFALVLSSFALALAAPRLGAGDVAALQRHHGVNLMEIELAQQAQAHGSDPVKKYAAALMKDHQKADKEAIALAAAHGLTLDDEAAVSPAKLDKLDGVEFDRAYLQAMIDGHTAEVGTLTRTIGRISDAKLKAHLTKVKPVVEKHAEQARALMPPAPK